MVHFHGLTGSTKAVSESRLGYLCTHADVPRQYLSVALMLNHKLDLFYFIIALQYNMT